MIQKPDDDISMYIKLILQIGLIMITTIITGFGLGILIGKLSHWLIPSVFIGTLAGIFIGFWIVYMICLKKI